METLPAILSPTAWEDLVPPIREDATREEVRDSLAQTEIVRAIRDRVYNAMECYGKAIVHEAEAEQYEARLKEGESDRFKKKKLMGMAIEQKAKAEGCRDKIDQFRLEVEAYRALLKTGAYKKDGE